MTGGSREDPLQAAVQNLLMVASAYELHNSIPIPISALVTSLERPQWEAPVLQDPEMHQTTIIGDCMFCFYRASKHRPTILDVRDSAGREVRWPGLGGMMSPWMELNTIRHHVGELLRSGRAGETVLIIAWRVTEFTRRTGRHKENTFICVDPGEEWWMNARRLVQSLKPFKRVVALIGHDEDVAGLGQLYVGLCERLRQLFKESGTMALNGQIVVDQCGLDRRDQYALCSDNEALSKATRLLRSLAGFLHSSSIDDETLDQVGQTADDDWEPLVAAEKEGEGEIIAVKTSTKMKPQTPKTPRDSGARLP